MTENRQILVILVVKISSIKLSNTNFCQFPPESNQYWPNGVSQLPKMVSKTCSSASPDKKLVKCTFMHSLLINTTEVGSL